MLPETISSEIRDISGKYPLKKAAAADALRIVQRKNGWVSDEDLSEIANILEMSVHELENTASFYNQIFRVQAGKHIIRICDGETCWIRGYESLVEHIHSRLKIYFGETSQDGLFTLLPISCLGACDKAPVMMVDDELHVNVTEDKIDRVLESLGGNWE